MRRMLFAGLWLAVMASAGRAEQEWAPKRIVSTGDLMPNGGAADHITSWPVINDRGEIAFVTSTRKDKPKLEFSTVLVVRDAQGKLRAPLQKGTDIGGGSKLDGMAAITMSDDGYIAAKVSMAGDAAMNAGPFGAMVGVGDAIVRVSPEGKVAAIAKWNDTAPGTTGTFLTLPNSPGLGKEGRMIFTAGIKEGGKGVGGGIWSVASDGSAKLVARKGMAIAGLKEEAFGTLMMKDGFLADDGTSAFYSFLAAKDGGSETAKWGAWRVNGKGELTPMMYSWLGSPLGEDKQGSKGEPSLFKSTAVNAQGDIALAFEASKTSIRAGVITVSNAGTVRVVATSETPADENGLKINGFEEVVINNKGKVAFKSWVFSDTVKGNFAIFTEGDDGKLRKLALAGAEAPGAGGKTFQFLDAPQLCATGQVAFTATLSDKKKGIWMTDAKGTLHDIAIAGQKMEFVNGPARVIADVSLCSIAGTTQSGGGDGKSRALNNSGTLVYYVWFEDKTQMILTGNFVNSEK